MSGSGVCISKCQKHHSGNQKFSARPPHFLSPLPGLDFSCMDPGPQGSRSRGCCMPGKLRGTSQAVSLFHWPLHPFAVTSILFSSVCLFRFSNLPCSLFLYWSVIVRLFGQVHAQRFGKLFPLFWAGSVPCLPSSSSLPFEILLDIMFCVHKV